MSVWLPASGAQSAGARRSTAWSSGIATFSNTTSWLPDARRPRWSQLAITRTPSAWRGTKNTPMRGAGSSVRAHTASQPRPSMPVV